MDEKVPKCCEEITIPTSTSVQLKDSVPRIHFTDKLKISRILYYTIFVLLDNYKTRNSNFNH